MPRLSKLAFYFVSAFTAVLLVLIGLFGQRCATVPISSVAFRPDGQEMLVVKLDGQVERWGGWPERAEYLYTTGHTGYIGGIAFSPDGKLIATVSEDTSVRLWDAETGTPLRTSHGIRDNNTAYIYVDIKFMADGQILCGKSYDRLILWDVKSLSIVQAFSTAGKYVLCSPDGRTIIDTYGSRTEVIDIQAGTVLHTYDYTQTSEHFACTPDGKIFFTMNRNATLLHIRDTSTSEVLAEFPVLEGSSGANFLVFAPDCRSALYSDNNRLRVWETTSGKTLLDIKMDGVIASASYAPDGKSLWGNTDGAVYQVDAGTGEQLNKFTTSRYPNSGPIFNPFRRYGIAISPDGTRIAASGSDKRIWVWDTKSGKLLNRFYGHTASVRSATYTPDGKGLLTTGDDHVAFLWDLSTGKPLRMFERHWEGVISGAVSPDGKLVMTLGHTTGGPKSDVIIWDAITGNRLKTITTITPIIAASLSPDGKLLATVSMGGTLSLWNTKTGELILDGPAVDPRVDPYGDVSKITFSSDSRRIAIAAKNTLRIFGFDGISLKIEHDFPETYSTEVTGLAFSPDGSTLAATFAGTGNQIYLWDAQGKLLKRMSHPGAHLTSLAFSPDGKTILTGSADGIPRLWDVETGTSQRALCPNIISRRYSAGGWLGLFVLIILPMRAFRRFSGRDRLRAA